MVSSPERKDQPASGTPSSSSSSSSTAATPAVKPVQPAAAQSTGKKGLVTRRQFLQIAMGASAVLAIGSVATSGQILQPLIPPPHPPKTIATRSQLDSYLASNTNVIDGPLGKMPYDFFYWPYDPSVSPYYKNVIAKLPDALAVGRPHPYVGFNTTCVHLQCLVNPGVGNGEYRLQCPCHGSQYRIQDAVPVKGPAYDLNLGRLPRVKLRVDGNEIIAEPWDSSNELEGDPGIGKH